MLLQNLIKFFFHDFITLLAAFHFTHPIFTMFVQSLLFFCCNFRQLVLFHQYFFTEYHFFIVFLILNGHVVFIVQHDFHFLSFNLTLTDSYFFIIQQFVQIN